jgi:hypothetical protein
MAEREGTFHATGKKAGRPDHCATRPVHFNIKSIKETSMHGSAPCSARCFRTLTSVTAPQGQLPAARGGSDTLPVADRGMDCGEIGGGADALPKLGSGARSPDARSEAAVAGGLNGAGGDDKMDVSTEKVCALRPWRGVWAVDRRESRWRGALPRWPRFL